MSRSPFSLTLVVFASACATSEIATRYDALAGELARSERGPPEPAFDGATLDRAAVIRAVLASNPGLESARQAWRAALARTRQETAFDDPMVGYAIAPGSIGSDVRFGQEVMVSQRFPFPGKRDLRGAVALAEAEAARDDWRSARLRLGLMASMLFDELYEVTRTLAIVDEQAALVTRLKRSAKAQLAAGRASLQDPLQAEAERIRLDQQKVTLESRRGTAIAQLNALLHRTPDTPLPPPPSSLAEPDPPAASEALLEAALRERPDLRGMEARIRGAATSIDAAKREYWPDFGVNASWSSMWMDLQHQFMVGVTIDVPLQLGRRRGAVEEAEARHLAAQSEYETHVDAVRSEVEQARLRLVEAVALVALHKKRAVPVAGKQLDAAVAGFVAGRNTFVAVMDAARGRLEARLGLEMSLAEAWRRRAALDRALGRMPGLPGAGGVR